MFMKEFNAEIRHALTGPVASIPTPFLSDGEIDYTAIGKMIDFQIANKLKMIFLTPGNSHYNCMSTAEIYEMCRFVTKYTNKRVPVCVCNFFQGTKQTLDFAKFAVECGTDLLLPFPPNWANSMTADTLTDYYVEVAKIIPLMLIFSPLSGTDAAITNMEKALDRTDNIVAIKDDYCTVISRKMVIACRDRCAIFSGGQKQHYLNIRPYGADGYLSTIAMFKPEIAWQFWGAIKSGEDKIAMNIVEKIDMPMFEYLIGLPGSFDAGIHAIMEMHGFGSRVRRAPYYNLNNQEVEKLRDFLQKMELV
jgi:4-hydroxy-tetrahydrodipicolinate synthase